MSHLQWLGIWGMTGFSKPEKSDLDKWSKGITRLLADPKGVHYFKEFLSEPERDFETQSQILEVWADCEKLINQGTLLSSGSDMQRILDGARENLSLTSAEIAHIEVNINSGNEAQIRDGVMKVQEAARDDLNAVYNAFMTYTHTIKSPKKSKCLIL